MYRVRSSTDLTVTPRQDRDSLELLQRVRIRPYPGGGGHGAGVMSRGGETQGPKCAAEPEQSRQAAEKAHTEEARVMTRNARETMAPLDQ